MGNLYEHFRLLLYSVHELISPFLSRVFIILLLLFHFISDELRISLFFLLLPFPLSLFGIFRPLFLGTILPHYSIFFCSLLCSLLLPPPLLIFELLLPFQFFHFGDYHYQGEFNFEFLFFLHLIFLGIFFARV